MAKTLTDLMDMTLKEILENYVTIHNLECCFYYGIAPAELIAKLFDEYNIEKEYPEAFDVENLIPNDLLDMPDKPIMDYTKLERIMCNLGINKKGEDNDS